MPLIGFLVQEIHVRRSAERLLTAFGRAPRARRPNCSSRTDCSAPPTSRSRSAGSPQALEQWPGAVVVVSHDRELRHRFTGRIRRMDSGRLAD
ncbi:hypothetical protein [Streptomyces sp. NPDC048623]|uniref:hypothetical protein n=1 Tax=Streptomyces sp. NPDC048623 TaxID=3155761 RepID=UPI00344A82BA